LLNRVGEIVRQIRHLAGNACTERSVDWGCDMRVTAKLRHRKGRGRGDGALRLRFAECGRSCGLDIFPRADRRERGFGLARLRGALDGRLK
jgi:hypothetical protein